jgi:cellulose synthase/poly-beta-1,6-N-acetylglucosamine synthase-like glycosyltransferase
MAGLIAVPLLFAAIIYFYCFALERSSWPALLSALKLMAVLLLCYQFSAGANGIAQIAFSLRRIRNNALRRKMGRFELVDSPKVRPVSIIIWAQDQGYTIVQTIKSLLSLNYPDFEIIVINDGSTDDTHQVLEQEFGIEPLNRVFCRTLSTEPPGRIFSSAKYPILSVVEKSRTGRADSLNTGLNLAKAPLVCILDAGHLLARDGLVLLAKPFIEDPSLTLMSASTGEVEASEEGPASFSKGLLMVGGKRLFHSCLLERKNFCLVSGTDNAVRMFRKSDLIELGGFPHSVAKDDLQINLRLHRAMSKKDHNYRMTFLSDVICWRISDGEEPSFAARLSDWQAGVFQAVAGNIAILFSPRIEPLLRFSFLQLIFEIWGPLTRIFGLLLIPTAYLLGVISSEFLFLYFFASIVFALLESLGGLIADELSTRRPHSLTEIANLILASLIEGSLYRHVTDIWRVRGLFNGLRK